MGRNLRVPQNVGKFFNIRITGAFSRSAQLDVVSLFICLHRVRRGGRKYSRRVGEIGKSWEK
jgi:hypothetical protein